MKEKMKDCPRCGGYGLLLQFLHVESGVCFQCMGLRKVPLTKQDKNQKKRFKARAIKQGWAIISEGRKLKLKLQTGEHYITTGVNCFYTSDGYGHTSSEYHAQRDAWKLHFSGLNVNEILSTMNWIQVK